MTNYFASAEAARLYRIGRPYFHPLVVERFARFSGAGRVARALDVACGTGQSARALRAVADAVEATDSAAEMLAHADPCPGVTYARAAAEALPFPDRAFGLVSVGVAHHWLDGDRFLAEAARVLEPGGWLLVYSHGCATSADPAAGFAGWMGTAFPAHFPAPPRAAGALAEADLVRHGLRPVGDEFFEHALPYTFDQLVAFVATQSNVLSAVAEGRASAGAALEWIAERVRPFAPTGSLSLEFTAKCWYIQRGPEDPTRSVP